MASNSSSANTSSQNSGSLSASTIVAQANQLSKQVSFSHPLSVKLDQSNFLLWKQQVEAAIRGHRLQKFVFSQDRFVPQKFATPEDEKSEIYTQEFLDWDAQDNLIVSWLLSSMTQSILTKLVGCNTSSRIWTSLLVYFANQTKAKVSQFKDQLKELKKGNQSITDYLLKVKHIVDQLASVGHALSDSEHIDTIFSGLTEEYDSFIVSVHSRKDEFSVDEIESLLLAQEIRIEKRTKTVDSMSVNLANVQVSSQGKKYSPINTQSNQTYRNPFATSRGPGYGNGKGRGNGRGKTSWQNRPQCQLCGKIGHLSGKCYGRFDPNFPGLGSVNGIGGSTGYAISSNSVGSTQYGLGGSQPLSPTPMSAQMASYMATPECVADSVWYPDSGATNHVTANAQNLNPRTEYQGQDRIHMGNGFQGYPIGRET